MNDDTTHKNITDDQLAPAENWSVWRQGDDGNRFLNSNRMGTNSSTGPRSRVQNMRIKKGLEAQAPNPYST